MAAGIWQDVAVLAVIGAAVVYLLISAVQAIRHRRAGCCDTPVCQETADPSTRRPVEQTHFIPVENLTAATRQKST